MDFLQGIAGIKTNNKWDDENDEIFLQAVSV
jgi:hypothetical protein